MKSKICLTMIVRDEASIIARCLNAIRPFIDYWVIVDTGSVDSTMEIIRETLQDIPGQLDEHEWKGFGDAKTRALTLAREAMKNETNAYALVLDADEILDGEFPTTLTHDRYGIWMQTNNLRYPNHRLFKLNRDWRYVGVRHEFPTATGPWTEAMVEGLTITTPRDGARGKNPKVYENDAAALEEALREIGDVGPSHPDYPLTTRYRFYLAQSYRDSGNDKLAIANYLRRADMGSGLNWEEIYVSLLQAARAWSRLGNRIESDRMFLRAHHVWGDRAEALRDLSMMFEQRLDEAEKKQPVGMLFIESPLAHKKPKSISFPYFGPIEDGSTCTPLGFRVAQNRMAVPVLSYLIEMGEFDQIIEFGTHFGGLTAILAFQCRMLGMRIDSFDLHNNVLYASELELLKVNLHHIDVFSDECQGVVKGIIDKSKRVLMLCDNGDKVREIHTYAPFLKPGDVIGAHDYHPTGAFDPERWRWQEVRDEQLVTVSREQHLVPYFQELCTEAAWWMRVKGTP